MDFCLTGYLSLALKHVKVDSKMKEKSEAQHPPVLGDDPFRPKQTPRFSVSS